MAPDPDLDWDSDERDFYLNTLDQAAVLCHLGMDGWEFLHSGDHVDHVMLAALVGRLRKLRRLEQDSLATSIINKLSEAMR